MKIKLLIALIFSTLSLLRAKDIHILVSKTPDAEKNSTYIPGTTDYYDSDNIVTSIKKAHQRLASMFNTTTLNKNVTISIRKGEYNEGNIIWDFTSNDSKKYIKIINYPGEKVIFYGDGLNSAQGFGTKFFELSNKNGRTNVWIEGLIIKNFINGIYLGEKERDDTTCNYDTTVFNSYNVIKNNIFTTIGNLRVSDTTEYVGYGAINTSNSCNNIIDNNIFYNIENRPENGPSIHAIYMTNYSNDNTIKNNYFHYCSGTAIKLRNNCDDNTIDRNYFDQAGTRGFVESWHCNSFGYYPAIDSCNCSGYTGNGEGPSDNIVISNNICTFQYPHYSNGSINLFYDEWKRDYSSETNQHSTVDSTTSPNFVIRSNPKCEDIVASTSGDINGDGIEEIFTAINYDDFCIILRSEMGDEPYLSRPIYRSTYWRVGGLTVNDFDGNGTDELIVGFNDPIGNSRIYKGNGNWSVTNLGFMSAHTGWKVSAMTSGNYDGSSDGKNEIFVGFVSTSSSSYYDTEIWKGDGEYSATNYNRTSGHIGWSISALTSGDYDGNGKDDILVGFNALPSSTGFDAEVWRGNGVTSATNYGKIYYNNWWHVGALTSGDYDNDGKDEVFVGFNRITQLPIGDKTQVWKGNGLTSVGNYGKKYDSQVYNTGQLISAKFSPTAASQLISLTYDDTTSAIDFYFGQNRDTMFTYGTYYEAEDKISCLSPKLADIELESEIEQIETIIMFPNPITKSETLYFKGISTSCHIQIYSNTGQLVKTAINKSSIHLGELPSGLYHVQIIEPHSRQHKKLIIQ